MSNIFAQPYYTGQPLGTLSFYIAGTLTLSTIYADEAATIPLPNPVTADADGRFPAIYLSDAIEYRCIEKDSNGVPVGADVDPVNPPVAIGGGTVTGNINVVGTVKAQTPNTGTTGGFQLIGNATSGFNYFQVLDDDGTTEWGNWRYDNTGLARWSGAVSVLGALSVSGAVSGGAAAFTGRARTVPVALTVAANTALNVSLSNAFTAAMTANITTLTISNAAEGQAITVLFTQDGVGGRTIAWPASFRWAGGSPPVLSLAANAVDLLSAQYINGAWHAALAKAFA